MKTFLIQQKIQPLVNQYAVYEADAEGKAGAMVAFAQQKRLSFKEKFTVYGDDTKAQIVFELQARQMIDLGARYDVRDTDGTIIGTLGKDFKSSLLRSTWHVFRPGEEASPALIVQERNKNLAIVRRVWELLPVLSEIPFFVKYHFDFINPADGQVVASYNKTTTLFDHYQLTINDETTVGVDWRVLVGLGIMMDALQGR